MELAPAEQNAPRLAQLQKALRPEDLQMLSDNRDEVMSLVRLGRKWGFFSLAEKTSKHAGREVLQYAHMPESNLAVLIGGRDPESLAALEKTIDGGMAEDPKYLARLLISRINDLYQKESAEHGTVALTVGDAPAMLEGETDPKSVYRWVNKPAPTHAVPAWFKVIDQHGMGPQDLEMVYGMIDQQIANSSEARVEQVLSDEHDAVLEAANPAA